VSLPHQPTDYEIKLALVELLGAEVFRESAWRWWANIRENRAAVIAAIADGYVRAAKSPKIGVPKNPGGWLGAAYERHRTAALERRSQ
jgi:predicted RNA polymerase sigma factor